jgi:LysM repeat protein
LAHFTPLIFCSERPIFVNNQRLSIIDQPMKSFLFLLLFIPLFSLAQKTHKVGPKETIYSIGRMYNVHPRELAQYNGLSISDGLQIDQVLKIPAKTTMAPLPPATTTTAPSAPITPAPAVPAPAAPAPKADATQGQPIYHVVQKKETLFQIKRTYAGVSIEDLKRWNNLQSDGLSEGMRLIVGYANGNSSTKSVAPTPAPVTPPSAPVTSPKAPVEPKPQSIASTEPVQEPVQVKTDEKPISTPAADRKTKKSGAGFFKNQFQERDGMFRETGMAGAFKSTSGWEDGKYYCLHNQAPAGTIMQITATTTGKTIYAKVLDVIPDIQQNKGLMLRLSNAAATELGIEEERFEVSVAY